MTVYRPLILQSIKGPHVLNLAYPFKDGLRDNDGAAPVNRAADGSFDPDSWPYRALGADESTGVALTSGSPWVQEPALTAAYIGGRFAMIWYSKWLWDQTGLVSSNNIEQYGLGGDIPYIGIDRTGRLPTQWTGGPFVEASWFSSYSTWDGIAGHPWSFNGNRQVSYYQFGSTASEPTPTYSHGPDQYPEGCDVEYDGAGTNLSPVSVTVEWRTQARGSNYAQDLNEPNLSYIVELPSLPYMQTVWDASDHKPVSSAIRAGIIRVTANSGDSDDSGWMTSTFTTDHWPITLVVVGSEIYTGVSQMIGEISGDTSIYQETSVRAISCSIEVLPPRYRFVEIVGVGGLG